MQKLSIMIYPYGRYYERRNINPLKKLLDAKPPKKIPDFKPKNLLEKNLLKQNPREKSPNKALMLIDMQFY